MLNHLHSYYHNLVVFVVTPRLYSALLVHLDFFSSPERFSLRRGLRQPTTSCFFFEYPDHMKPSSKYIASSQRHFPIFFSTLTTPPPFTVPQISKSYCELVSVKSSEDLSSPVWAYKIANFVYYFPFLIASLYMLLTTIYSSMSPSSPTSTKASSP